SHDTPDIYTLSLHDALPIYTFSDSFWYSAVEGEVYALSSFFTAVVFWAALKWEDEVSIEKRNGIKGHFTRADRWLILIFYLIGLDRKSTRLNSSHVKISYAV